MTFSQKWKRTVHKKHRRKAGKAGVFGGQILSQTQIQKLNERIKDHEATEFAKFEEVFDNDLKQI